MATKEQIVKAILDAANNPIIGAIVENVDALAEAVFLLDNPAPTVETRVVVPDETRQFALAPPVTPFCWWGFSLPKI